MFKENFKRLCKEKGVAPTIAMQEIGLNRATYSLWDENTVPKKDTLVRISKYFDCSISDLLVDYKPQEEQSDTNVSDIFEELRTDPNKRMLFSAMQGATAQEIKQAALILETLKKTRQQ